jgi:hypothetical protein
MKKIEKYPRQKLFINEMVWVASPFDLTLRFGRIVLAEYKRMSARWEICYETDQLSGGAKTEYGYRFYRNKKSAKRYLLRRIRATAQTHVSIVQKQ